MKTTQLCIFLFISTLNLTSQGNNVVDSLISSYEYAINDTARLKVITQILRYTQRSNEDLSSIYLNKFDSLANKLGHPYYKGRSKILRGNGSFYQGNYEEAVHNFLDAQEFFAQAKDTAQLASTYNNIAAVYRELDQEDKVFEFLHKAYKLYQVGNDYRRLAIITNNIGSSLIELQDYNKAKKYLDRSIEYYEKIQEKIDIGFAYSKMALLYRQRKKYEASLDYELSALEAYRGKYDLHSIRSYTGLLSDYTAINQLKAGQRLIAQVEKELDLSKYPREQIKWINAKMLLYEKSQNYLQAYELTKIINNKKDSLLNLDKELELNAIIEKHNSEKKEQEIALLNIRKKHDLKTIYHARIIAITLGLGSLGLLVFMFYLRRLNKKVGKQNITISKNLTEKETLLREIHHRVKNNLQVVSSLLNLQSRHTGDINAKKVLREGQNRVRSMALIHQNLYQEDNLMGINIQDYLTRLSENLFTSYNIYNDKVKLILDIDPISLDVDTVVPVGLIINELISNALKHAFPNGRTGTIKVQLKEENDTLWLLVKDDGKGIEGNHYNHFRSSFGYRLISAFSAQLEGEFNIEAQEGTCFSLEIKDFKKL